jgi:hypothetical protein
MILLQRFITVMKPGIPYEKFYCSGGLTTAETTFSGLYCLPHDPSGRGASHFLDERWSNEVLFIKTRSAGLEGILFERKA